jgi:hypothetical protein
MMVLPSPAFTTLVMAVSMVDWKTFLHQLCVTAAMVRQVQMENRALIH